MRFYAETFAPWCERARWVLDRHAIAYREIEQVPLIAEVRLRVAIRRLSGRVTVPLLVDGPTILMSSDAIARHVDERRATGETLFPEGEEIERWMGWSEELMIAGRALLLPRMLANDAALEEQLPPFVPRALRGVLRPIAKGGVKHVVRKYETTAIASVEHMSRSRRLLDELRQALSTAPRLVDARFSYADITAAAALQFVLPVADRFIGLGPATRAAWTNDELAREYADVLAWRDDLYGAERSVGISEASKRPSATARAQR